jgi:hypothetical protein
MHQGAGGNLVGLFVVAAGLMAVVATITGRRLEDPDATRPRAIYLSVAMLPTLLLAVVGAVVCLEAIVRLILGPEPQGGQALKDLVDRFAGAGGGDVAARVLQSLPENLRGLAQGAIGRLGIDPTDAFWRKAVGAGIAAIVAGGVHWLHYTWRKRFLGTYGIVSSPAGRTFQAYAYTTTFVFVVGFVVGLVGAGYGLFRIVAPGVTAVFAVAEDAEREVGVAQLVAGGALAIASWFIVDRHWKLAARLRRGEMSPVEPSPAGEPKSAPEEPELAPEESGTSGE